ncbi:AIPR family protein [Clostridium perfringens]|uniref:AIPR family protein n=1 Tax=Clostridium perfringens TaxID=1502 RepID=UPI002A58ECF4|nr:AIPR family protein [Clostridium perfringens]
MSENLILKFPVESFRKIPNPYHKKEDGEKGAMMYIAICDIKNIAENIPMDTNPREQKLTTGVAKKIRASASDNTHLDFYLLNRGILLSTKDVTFNNYNNELTLIFEDFDVHGCVDGGHTYKIIKEIRNTIEYGTQFVKIEILTGVEDIFQRLAAARNTSVQVQDKSIAELEDRFNIIKNTIKEESFSNRVYFKENDEGDIDVADILAILNLFNIDKYKGMEEFPTNSYSRKKQCIDLYIDYHKKFQNSLENPYVKMKPIMNDFFKLYDKLEVNIGKYYRAQNQSGKYGLVKGVSCKKEKYFKSKFYENEMEYSSPTGFLYPILGAFRALIQEEDGEYKWIKDPFVVMDEIAKELVNTTVDRSRTLGNNPQSTGKDTGNWQTLYMRVKFALID